MKRKAILPALALLLAANTSAAAQQHQSQPPTTTTTPASQQALRDATREKLRTLLNSAGPKINVDFRQSDKQPYNFVGFMKQELKNADSLEIVISVSEQQTIHFRIYPHYKDGYVNVDKVGNSADLMRLLLRFSNKNFLYWGADESGDIFAGYNFTLESGFPEAAIRVVINSIASVDQFVGQLRQAIDGTQAP